MDFNSLPFEDCKNIEIFEVSDFYIEFGDEPKLRIHRYRERPNPYLSYWFAVTSEWFPENQFLTLDIRKVFDEPSIRLPFKSEDKLKALGERIVNQFPTQIEFLKRVCDSRLEPEPEVNFDFTPVDSTSTAR